jgi:protein dithiol:quinone oxidoreductase
MVVQVRNRRPQQLLLAVAATSLAAVAAALVSQHRFDMQPCPWCVLQRLVFVAIALATLPALLVRQALLQRVVAGAVLALALCGAAAALWQHLVAASSTSCKLTLADRIVAGLGLDSLLPSVFAAYASCADAAVRIAGVPYEFFSLALFVAMGAVALQVLRLR